MNKHIKRLISVAVAGIMLAGSLASCGGLEEFEGDLRGRYDFDLTQYVREGKYKRVSVYIGSEDVSDEELDLAIYRNRVYYPETPWESVGEGVPAEKGNIVDVRYQGYLYGEKLSDLTHSKEEGYSMVIGGEMLIKGFDEHLIGMKIGDKKTFELTVPDPCFDYPYYVGETVTFEIEITGIRSAELMEYDADFAAMYGAASIEEFEATTLTELRRQRESKLETYIIARAMTEAEENFKIKKLPEDEVESVRLSMENGDKTAAEEAGVTFEEYIMSEYDMTADEYAAAVAERAKDIVSEELILYYIARKEKLALTSAEFDERATALAEENGLSTPAQYMSFMASYGYSEYDVREQIWYEMVTELIRENVVLKYDE